MKNNSSAARMRDRDTHLGKNDENAPVVTDNISPPRRRNLLVGNQKGFKKNGQLKVKEKVKMDTNMSRIGLNDHVAKSDVNELDEDTLILTDNSRVSVQDKNNPVRQFQIDESYRSASEEYIKSRAGTRNFFEFDQKKKHLRRVGGETIGRPTNFDLKSRKMDGDLRSNSIIRVQGRSSDFDQVVSKILSRKNYTDRVHGDITQSKICASIHPLFDYVWRGWFKIGDEMWGLLGGHTSTVAREKERGLSKLLPRVMCMEKVFSPQIFETRLPKIRDIDIFFFPQHSRVEEMVDGLLQDMAKGNYVLKFSLVESEFFVFSSSIFEEPLQRFHGRCYLWGLFKPRRLKTAQDQIMASNNSNQKQIQPQIDAISTGDENVNEYLDSKPKKVTINFMPQENQDISIECLNLFPECSENIAVRSRVVVSDELELDLGLRI